MLVPLALLLAAALTAAQPSERPLVSTLDGPVRGEALLSASGKRYYSFKGIPYAKPPIGALRFRRPLRHPGWDGELDATAHGNRCLQNDLSNPPSLIGGEDCLYANVYTSQLPAAGWWFDGLPVMVWIHGGDFESGSGDTEYYGPDYLMDEHVVVVTFNYRLGVLGFLTTHDDAAPGNYGMIDQVLLLTWVRENIAAFGGDPTCVTVFGQSVGGASVTSLVLSPLARGLFHRAISQSGKALSTIDTPGREDDLAARLGQAFDCPSGDNRALLECLKGVPAEDLAITSKRVATRKYPFNPRVDCEAENPFLAEDPRLSLVSGNFNRVPWIIGINEDEGGYFALRKVESLTPPLDNNPRLNQILDDIREDTVSGPLDPGAFPGLDSFRLMLFYAFGAGKGSTVLKTISNIIGDYNYVAPISEKARLASRFTRVYKYVLDHMGPGRLSRPQLALPGLPDLGVTHGDDVPYLFRPQRLTVPADDSPEFDMHRLFTSLWTSFALTGRPVGRSSDVPDWPVFTEKTQLHLRLNLQPSVAARFLEERDYFWQSVPVNESWRHPVFPGCPHPDFGGGYWR